MAADDGQAVEKKFHAESAGDMVKVSMLAFELVCYLADTLLKFLHRWDLSGTSSFKFKHRKPN